MTANDKTTGTTYAIVLTWDCGDPDVYGPFTSEAAATEKKDKIQAGWGDWEWDATTGCTVRKMEN